MSGPDAFGAVPMLREPTRGAQRRHECCHQSLTEAANPRQFTGLGTKRRYGRGARHPCG